ncbi:protein kinase domain-containing protein, partial [Haematococcus lacustris]
VGTTVGVSCFLLLAVLAFLIHSRRKASIAAAIKQTHSASPSGAALDPSHMSPKLASTLQALNGLTAAESPLTTSGKLQAVSSMLNSLVMSKSVNKEVDTILARHRDGTAPLTPSSFGTVSTFVTLTRQLGAGSFGTVYAGIWGNTEVAVKIIAHTPAAAQRVKNEVELSLRLDHPNVVRSFFYETFDLQCAAGQEARTMGRDTQETWIVLELCTAGSLSSRLYSASHGQARSSRGRDDEAVPMPLPMKLRDPMLSTMTRLLQVALGVAQGMAYLHSLSITHGDLKTENVLLTTDSNGNTVAKVAVKIIAHTPAAAQRVKNEVELSLRLDHPNVVRSFFYETFDLQCAAGQEARTMGRDTQETWIVLELCTAGSLSSRLYSASHGQARSSRGRDDEAVPMPLPMKLRDPMLSTMTRLLQVALGVAQGMAYLHSLSITHGDLKTENVLLTTDSNGNTVAKVGDFGLSRAMGDNCPTHLSTATVGTVTHMPPELLSEGRLRPSCDVYSFGIILWQLFTGEVPYAGMHYAVIVYQQALAPAPLPLLPELTSLPSGAMPWASAPELHAILAALAAPAWPSLQGQSAQSLAEHVSGLLAPSTSVEQALALHSYYQLLLRDQQADGAPG